MLSVLILTSDGVAGQDVNPDMSMKVATTITSGDAVTVAFASVSSTTTHGMKVRLVRSTTIEYLDRRKRTSRNGRNRRRQA